MKSICICGPYPSPVGGVSIHVRRLSEFLKEKFKVYLIDESPIRKPDVFNIRTFNFFSYFSLLRKSDLVHVNSSVVFFRFMHVFMAVCLSKKIVVTVHSYRRVNFFLSALNYLSFKMSHVNIVVSGEISKNFPAKHVIIPAFIQPTKNEMSVSDVFVSLISKIQNSGKKLVVSNAYRLDFVDGREVYGFSDLIDLFKDVDVNEKYTLILNVSTLNGCVDAYKKLIRVISECNLNKHVYLLNEEVNFAGLLRHADTFVRATSTDGDALSVRESLLFGVRTIASDCVLRPNGTILYKDGDIASLKDALLTGLVGADTDSLSFENEILEIYKGLI